jgi:limonene-1,2-epoxide hydrolase
MNWRKIGIVSAGFAVVCFGAFAQAPRMNQQEQEALRIVNAWDDAWNQKDPQKMLSYMSDDLVAGDGRNVWKGKAELLDAYKRLNMTGITYEVVSEYAAGGEGQTVVVQKRIDHVNMNGRKMDLQFVGYFRVRDGKIMEWQDVGIGRMPAGLAPGGAPPGGR